MIFGMELWMEGNDEKGGKVKGECRRWDASLSFLSLHPDHSHKECNATITNCFISNSILYI